MPEFVLDLGCDFDRFKKLDSFTQGFVEAVYWTEEEELNGATFADLTDESLEIIVAECKEFQQLHRVLLDKTSADDHRHGVDFWLTRNRHGAGFWDRGYDDTVGKMLTEQAHGYGSAYVYTFDEQVHFAAG